MQIDIENLSVKYNNIIALDSINITFQEHDLWAICGSNGAGKSTLLKSILGLVSYSGKVLLKDMSMKNIAYLPQVSVINNTIPLTVYELISMGLWYENYYYKGVTRIQESRINNILREMGMISYAKRNIGQLSMGQLQKVLFARMLIQNADFLLLDEPFNFLDTKTVDYLLNLICELNDRGKTIICVTHDIEQVKRYFTKVLILSNKVIKFGISKDIL